MVFEVLSTIASYAFGEKREHVYMYTRNKFAIKLEDHGARFEQVFMFVWAFEEPMEFVGT